LLIATLRTHVSFPLAAQQGHYLAKVGWHRMLELSAVFVRQLSSTSVLLMDICSGASGPVTTFIVEPFHPHTHEFYLCIQVSSMAGYQTPDSTLQ
jgi:hypothetical protein